MARETTAASLLLRVPGLVTVGVVMSLTTQVKVVLPVLCVSQHGFHQIDKDSHPTSVRLWDYEVKNVCSGEFRVFSAKVPNHRA